MQEQASASSTPAAPKEGEANTVAFEDGVVEADPTSTHAQAAAAVETVLPQSPEQREADSRLDDSPNALSLPPRDDSGMCIKILAFRYHTPVASLARSSTT